ncbi:MAG TPA: NAD(P)H-dependent glycerol-3-phosphate dehydrogenase [Phaeodactylibacter sp.]|nr:NAD(P)H-dependent glycerol-3-phosphate dehydrogenase [Phaeodactylibacter sp.]
MEVKNKRVVGVIGAGSFGTTIANLLSYNRRVLLYSRNKDLVEKINTEHRHFDLDLSKDIIATHDLAELADTCRLIFPIVPSLYFRSMMKDLAPHLRPYHLLIHGTKGFDITGIEEEELTSRHFDRSNVHTMSEVIAQESNVIRIGCLSGPNLAVEIMAGQPAATVIGSKFTEVIKKGRNALDSSKFHVFGTHDILGAELAGALKNAIAIGSGILGGLGMGKNIQALLITRGLMEMIYFGKAMGAMSMAFVGTAGIGDLVATATSTDSRNYTFGMRLARGESLQSIQQNMPELAEGVRTIAITHQLAKVFKLHAPITNTLYKVVFENFPIDEAMNYLMNYPYDVDVDFL